MYSFANSSSVRTSSKTALGVDFSFSENVFASRTELPPLEVHALKRSAMKRNKLEYFISQRYEVEFFLCVIGITKHLPLTFVR
jgi:hypothetical protein